MEDDETRGWLVAAVGGHGKPAESEKPDLESRNTTRLPTISLNELDVLRWRMAWGAPRIQVEPRLAYSQPPLFDDGAGLIDGNAGLVDG